MLDKKVTVESVLTKTIEENIDNICKYFRNYIISLKEELDEKEK